MPMTSAFSEVIVALLLSYISDFCIYFSFSCVKPISTFYNTDPHGML